MELDFTVDAEWQTQVDKISHHYQEHAVDFQHRSYGEEVVSVAILFMCRDASIKFKQRVHFRRAKAEFYTDVVASADRRFSVDEGQDALHLA